MENNYSERKSGSWRARTPYPVSLNQISQAKCYLLYTTTSNDVGQHTKSVVSLLH